MPIAIDIGSKYIKIVKGGINKKGSISVTDCFIEPSPEGAVVNGYIKNSTALISFLGGLIRKYNLGKNNCYVNVKSSDIIAREFHVPVIKGPKLNKIIQNEILSIFGVSNEYYIEYVITDTTVIDYKNIYKVLAYAIPKNMVLNYYELISAVNLKPVSLDVHRNSISKLFKSQSVRINNEPVFNKVMILADVGGSYLDLDLVIDSKSIFKRSVPISDELMMEDDITTGFANEYDSVPDGNEYTSYLNSEMGMNDYYFGTQTVGSSVSPIFTKINEEIYKMMQFAISREGGKSVTDVYLYGGNSRMQNLDTYLASSLEVSVNKILNISDIELNLEADTCDIMIASGSLIRL